MNPQVTKSDQTAWIPLVEEGVKTNGIFVKVLRFDEISQRSPTFLLKFEAGASYPNHDHPGGEEAFVLEGEVQFGKDRLAKGDYLYTPPGAKHAAFSKTGCVMLLVIPEEVVIV